MCGRIVGHVDIAAIKKLARINSSRKSKQVSRSFNMGPGSRQAIVIHSSFKSRIQTSTKKEKKIEKEEEFKNHRFLTCSQWGIEKQGKKQEKEGKILHFNLRIENVQNIFKRLIMKRSVMVVDGYFEWSDSQPYMVKHKFREVFFFGCFRLGS
jgi:putative SOS response-associated peptidase YedK